MHAIAEMLSRAETAGGGAGGAGGEASGGAGKNGDVIDAEYTEEKGGDRSS